MWIFISTIEWIWIIHRLTPFFPSPFNLDQIGITIFNMKKKKYIQILIYKLVRDFLCWYWSFKHHAEHNSTVNMSYKSSMQNSHEWREYRLQIETKIDKPIFGFQYINFSLSSPLPIKRKYPLVSKKLLSMSFCQIFIKSHFGFADTITRPLRIIWNLKILKKNKKERKKKQIYN